MYDAHHAPWVLTGMPRSGTTFSAALLTRVGMDFGHEEVFHPHLTHYMGMGKFDGDASWLAVPFLGELPGDSRVVIQVRDPLKVVGSLVGTQFLEPMRWWDERRDMAWAWTKWKTRGSLAAHGYLDHVTATPRPTAAFRSFLRARLPEIWAEDSPVTRALRFWLEWNRLALRWAERFDHNRIQILERLDGPSLCGLTAFYGVPITPEQAGLALSKVPTTTNQRLRVTLQWEDIPAGQLRDDAAALARHLGYETPHPSMEATS